MIHKPGAHHPWDMDELASHYDELARLERLVQSLKHSVLTPARRKELEAEVDRLQSLGLLVLKPDALAGVKAHRDARNG